MKNCLRFICMIIISVMILCACEGSAPEIIPEYDNGSVSADLGGFVLNWGWNTSEDTVIGFIPGTANADNVLERKKNVEDELNCKINMVYNSNIIDTLRTGVMSGSQTLDLLVAGGYTLVVDVRAGYLSGLTSLIDVNNIEKWGTPNMLQSMIWQDDLFAVIPFAWPDLVYEISGHLLAVNENLVARLAQPDPREFVENGTWTWDTFEDTLVAYTYEDAGNTVYALRSHPPYFAINFLLSSGVAFSDYEDGNVVCGVYTETGREALERAKQIFTVTHKDCFHPLTDSVGHDEFINGEAVMYLTWTYELTTNTDWIMYQLDNVGVLPFPQGPKATPGVYLSYHEGLGTCTAIPFNAKDSAASAVILSAMYEPFDQYQTKDDIIDYMTSQIFYDRRDTEIIINVIRNTEYGFFREGARSAVEESLTSDKSITQLLDSYRSRYDEIVEKYMVPHYQGRISVYGE